MKSLAKDDSCTKKANPGDDLRRHPRGASFVGKQTCEDHKARRADRDPRIGPQAGHPLTPLAFESDACAHEGGHAEADGGLINRCGHSENPVRFAGTFAGAPDPRMPRAAPATASLIRQFENRYVKSCAADEGSSHSA